MVIPCLFQYRTTPSEARRKTVYLFIINLYNTIMKYFTLRDLLHSEVAVEYGIVNLPSRRNSEQVYYNLTYLVDNLLDPIRERFATPMVITSGYRCERLNALVGGAKKSQHMKGEAVDFYFEGYVKEEMIMAFLEIAEKFNFDQMIYYKKKGIIHISYRRERNRNQLIIR